MYNRSEADFQRWLNSEIWINGCKKGCRREYIPDLAKSIEIWMGQRGYIMDSRWGPLAVSKWLYAIQIAVVARKQSIHTLLGYPDVLHRNWPEDQDNFDMNVGFDEREEFLDGWDACEDFDKTMPSGQKIRLEFEELLWTYVNLEQSRQGRKVAALVEDSDNEEDDDNDIVDPYIQDYYN
jgi:hypothetical protein